MATRCINEAEEEEDEEEDAGKGDGMVGPEPAGFRLRRVCFLVLLPPWEGEADVTITRRTLSDIRPTPAEKKEKKVKKTETIPKTDKRNTKTPQKC